MFYRMALAFFSAMIGFVLIALPSATVSAVDGYRLCAVRKGVCKCQKIGDQAGVLRVMDSRVCTKGPGDNGGSGKIAGALKAAAQNSSMALPAAVSTPSRLADVKSVPDKIKITKPPSKFSLFNIKMPKMPSLPKLPSLPSLPKMQNPGAAQVLRPVATGAKYRLCAVRKGTCKCQKIGDAAGVLTEMDAARCIPDTPPVASLVEEPVIAEKPVITVTPPATVKKIAEDKIDIGDLQKQLARAGYDARPADGSIGPKTSAAIKNFQKKNGLKVDGIASSSLLAVVRKAPTVKIARSKPSASPARIVVARAKTPKADVALVPMVTPTPVIIPTPVTAPIAVIMPAPAPVQTAARAPAIRPLAKPKIKSKSKSKINDRLKPVPVVAKAPIKAPIKAKTKIQKREKKPAIASSRLKAVQEKLTALGFDPGEANGKLRPETTTAINEFQESVGIPVDGKVTKRLLQHLSDLAPDDISEPIFANKTPAATKKPDARKPLPHLAAAANSKKLSARNMQIAAKPSIAKRPAAKALTARRTAPRRSYSITAPASSTFSNPLAGLLGSLKADTKQPTSMDGFRNCAVRKGACLCQKIGHQPGVWTAMDDSVCIRRPVIEETAKNEAGPETKVPAQKVMTAPAPVALSAPLPSVKAKQVATVAPAAKPQASSSFLDTISTILKPEKSGANPTKQ